MCVYGCGEDSTCNRQPLRGIDAACSRSFGQSLGGRCRPVRGNVRPAVRQCVLEWTTASRVARARLAVLRWAGRSAES